MSRRLHFTRIISVTDQLASQLQRLHFRGMRPSDVTWEPAVNIYAYADNIEVCMDLAGVRKQDIKVDVEPRRLVVRGHREFPDSACEHPPCHRILVMEIPDGTFERVLEFPLDVDAEHATARQDNGWLWITLPISSSQEVES